MAFSMKRSPRDEKLFHNYKDRGDENIFTLGKGSYTSTFDLPLGFAFRKINVVAVECQVDDVTSVIVYT